MLSIISLLTSSSISFSGLSSLYLLKSIGFPYVIVTLCLNLNSPLTPTGITGVPVFNAKNAAPFCAFPFFF